MTSSTSLGPWEARMAELIAEWNLRDVPVDDVDQWDAAMASMQAEVDDLRSKSEWRSGPRTLLAALGLHHRELVLTAGLGWLLNPDGHHGLGPTFLDEFLRSLGLPKRLPGPVSIQLEEQRNLTRADLVVRCPQLSVVVEVKVWALEQSAQCARLASEWADEDPTLVYLTPRGVSPTTAGATLDRWHSLSWVQLTESLERAARRSQPSPGVHDYLSTLAHDLGRQR